MKTVSQEKLYEAQQALYGEADQLFETWKDYIEPIQESMSDIDDITLATTAICLNNTKQWLQRMDEVTQTVQVGSFIKHGFELISAILPSLIANEVVSVQPMTRRNGEVFFLEFLYGTTRGDIVAGQRMFAYNAVGNNNTYYSAENDVEETIATGDGTNPGPFVGNLNSIPLVPGSVRVTDTIENFTDDGQGNLTGDAGGNGTIQYDTGAFSVTFAVAPLAAQPIVATYDLDFQANSDLIPEVDVSITSQPVTAQNRKLRARYTLDAAYDVEQAWGRSIDNDLKAALAGEVRHESDGRILNQLYVQGTAPSFPWSRTPASPEVPWNDHKWEFYDNAILAASNGIFDVTRRVTGNFVIAGTSVANVIEALQPIFKPEGSAQPGPHYIGTIGDKRVYKNPYFANNQWLAGYKGNLFLDAGFIWAPYLPIYTTRTVVLDDTVGRFGIMQAAARKMVNSLYYSPNVIA